MAERELIQECGCSVVILFAKLYCLYHVCGQRDLNSYGLLHQILSLARLPISPCPRFCLEMYSNRQVAKRLQI
jgi:hypothetical protein